jgi:vacuolar-type H+-ATPase subunit I/STV1
MRLSILLVVLLAGCVADQKGQITQPIAPPVINIPPVQKLDTAELRQGIKDDIVASSNATANQMTGAVNASVSKLAEKITGLEANISSVINASANLNATASAELRAKLEASLNAVVELRTELKMVNEFNSKIEAKMSVDANLVRELQSRIDSLNATLSAKMDVQANAQAGLYNKLDTRLENINNTAGRDVNYFPQAAVEIIIAILGVVTIAIGWIGRNARLREKLRTDDERNERKILSDLLMETLAMLPESKAKDIRDLRAKLANRTQIGIRVDGPEPHS